MHAVILPPALEYHTISSPAYQTDTPVWHAGLIIVSHLQN
jgi:hypothetical protein